MNQVVNKFAIVCERDGLRHEADTLDEARVAAAELQLEHPRQVVIASPSARWIASLTEFAEVALYRVQADGHILDVPCCPHCGGDLSKFRKHVGALESRDCPHCATAVNLRWIGGEPMSDTRRMILMELREYYWTKPKSPRGSSPRPVIDRLTGKTYRSISEAGLKTGVASSVIHRKLKSGVEWGYLPDGMEGDEKHLNKSRASIRW